MTDAFRLSRFYRNAEFTLPCSYSIYGVPHIEGYLDDAADSLFVGSLELENMLDRGDGGDAERVELASRYWTGLDVFQDPEYAIELLLRVCATPANDKNNGARFRPTQARARSMLAAMLLGTLGDLSNAAATVGAQGFGGTDALAHALYTAAVYADEAAALGLSSCAVLQIAVLVESLRLRRPQDRGAALEDLRFEALGSLWRVRDALETDPVLSWVPYLTGDYPTRPAGVRVCAVKGCGIEETAKWSFVLVCGGPCPQKEKPAWCSRACAWAGWAAHKALCASHAKDKAVNGAGPTDAERVRTAMRTTLEGRDTNAENVRRFTAITQKTSDILCVDDFGEDTARFVRDYHDLVSDAEDQDHSSDEPAHKKRRLNEIPEQDSGDETETEESVRLRRR
ncbi:hypothetical protein PsYK624_160660 [Phanerochaete sordida]|uniref:MYND-type domain-containing protein n=1 Tax=Phanerochaete sordida TaxID=48140 RepID=A0A9P3GUG8_9APHY|nr:hypothetical protein PsYK624_160660 [Phanerochaete sordida]